jgi:hypothetical protein
VKLTFLAYVALTIPVLAIVGVLMFMTLPRFFATSLDSLLYQGRVFTTAVGGGDILLMAAVGSQVALLTLSMLATAYVICTISRTALRAVWRWSQPTRLRRTIGSVVGAVVVGIVLVTWAPTSWFAEVGPADVLRFQVAERLHVDTPVSYEQTPPVGGPHAPLWQNCGFYDAPIRNEHGVHSLEHGAVWITYRPALETAQITTLRELAQTRPYVLVSPFPGLTSPVVASAWGHQLHLESAGDPRLVDFVRAFRLGPHAPERGGPCTGGAGRPRRR